MPKIEIKPCRCGADKIHVGTERQGFLVGCGIGCYNIACTNAGIIIMRIGLTEKQAIKRAKKAWNRRVSREKAD